MSSGVDHAIPDKPTGDRCITIEVVCLKDMPLLQRRREANKPLYLTRYE